MGFLDGFNGFATGVSNVSGAALTDEIARKPLLNSTPADPASAPAAPAAAAPPAPADGLDATKAALQDAADKLATAIAQHAGAPPAQADPYDYTDRYNTQLSPAEEAAYQAWGKQQAAQQSGRNPANDTYDYDMRGFWNAANGTPQFADNGHAGDQFKKPNHPTFSTLSQYNGVDGSQGGTWGGGQNGQPWTFKPGASNLQVHDIGDLQRYFADPRNGETNNHLILPAQTP